MDYIEYNPSLRLNFKVKQNKRTGSLTHDQKLEVLEKSKPLPCYTYSHDDESKKR